MKKIFISLNGYQRIGILLSIIWMVAGYNLQNRSNYKDAYSFSESQYNQCVAFKYSEQSCYDRKENDFKLIMENVPNPLETAIIPIPIGWIVIYLIIGIYKWIRAGFKHADKKGK